MQQAKTSTLDQLAESATMDNNTNSQPTVKKREKWWKSIGVEPVMFLYMSAFMLTSVVEEAFFVHKACTVNLGFAKEICDNLTAPEHKSYQHEVQIKVSTFHQYENIASHFVPILLAFFLGPWSDKVGRKLPLLLGLMGNFVYSVMIVVNDYMVTWPVEMILLTASLPCAITGGNLTVFMASFSYLADTTSQKSRTLRTTLLEVAYLFPMPTGVALGSYLFSHVMGRSYGRMFMINACLLFLAILYTCAFIKWKTANEAEDSPRSYCCIFDLIDLRHVAHSIKALIKKRRERRRLFLIFSLIAMAFYTFQRDEKHMIYLYSMLKFKWNVTTFSQFRTFQSSFFVLGLLLGVPIMERCFGLKDNVIIMIGATAHLITRIIFAAANQPYLFYVGAVIASLGPIVAPVLRSLTSKLVPPSDRGKIFALFSVADSTVPLVSGIIYTQVYNHTLNTFPQSIFLVTALSQAVVFVIALSMHILSKGKNMEQAKEVEDQEELASNS
ncbi:proton-coupled folate transporter isoform X2 [Rhodnius prolixus]|uniref:proton-coupled folate transporter isoform X2 n=1 Tax=Rhodnius prolixus TaxID=13249 RepID=UPI003D189646